MASELSVSMIRKKIQQMRLALTSDQVKELSDRVIRRYIHLHPRNQSFYHIGLYRSIPGELDLSTLETWLLSQQNCSIYFPRIVKKGEPSFGEIEFVQWNEKMIWQKGAFGILEPAPDCPAVDGTQLNLVFVPGVVFGENGERVGMGKGYYDRFFARNPHPLKVALAFDFQLLPEVPQNPWDQRVEWIVTEKRELIRKEIK